MLAVQSVATVVQTVTPTVTPTVVPTVVLPVAPTVQTRIGAFGARPAVRYAPLLAIQGACGMIPT